MAIANNIWKLYLIRISKWFMLFMPIVVLFFQSNGLYLRDVMLVNAVYALTVAVFEIPSGYFSDKLGRKNALIIGTFLVLLQFVSYSLSYTFLGFAIGAIFGGIGVSFISGTDSALLYDTLVVMNKKKDYVKWEGRSYAIGTFAEAVAAIIGGWIAYRYGMRMTIYGQVGISLLGVLVATTLVEPPIITEVPKDNWKHLQQILKETLFANQRLLFYLILSMIVGLACLLLAWFVQSYLEYQQVPAANMGTWWAVLNLTVALFSAQAYLLEQHISRRKMVGGLLLILIIGFVLLFLTTSNWVVGTVVLLVMYAARGVAVPVFANLINQEISSDRRATVLSIKGFGIRLTFAILAPILGWIADVFTILETFLALGIIIGIFTIMSLAFYSLCLRGNN